MGAPKRPRRVLLGLMAAGAGCAVILLASVSLLLVGAWQSEKQAPFQGFLNDPVLVEVPSGATSREVGVLLEHAGVIKSEFFFRLYLRELGGPPLQAGLYRFSGPDSLAGVVGTLRQGRVYFRKLTVPEGLDLSQIIVLLLQEGLGTLDGWVAAFHDEKPIQDLDPLARDLEGYLLPGTYFVDPRWSEARITAVMVDGFRELWRSRLRSSAREAGFTAREVVTLASLVEKETGRPEERPLVASVFHNRLRIGMKLMCDPTVIYAVKLVKEYDGVINRSDLELDSPYNSYLYPGLPPGPICSPGRESLLAAMNPEESPYLYFVSKNDGSHLFSTSYSNHAAAVQRYQR